jgi:hypothetical protein
VVSVRIEDDSPISCERVVKGLNSHRPSIRVYGGPGTRYRGLTAGFGFERGQGFIIIPRNMRDGDEVVVLKALRNILLVKE